MANVPGIIGAVVFGIGMSQFPAFTEQYQQRLNGVVDELRIITEEFDRTAASQNMSRNEALMAYSDGLFLGVRVDDLPATFVRYEELSEDLEILENADAMGRFTSFLHMTDNTLVNATWGAYEPSVPETPDGFLSDTSLATTKVLIKDKQALALGPGLGTGAATQRLIKKLVQETRVPLVIDADGLNCIVGSLELIKDRKAPTLLTPHPGEMARLTGKTTTEIQADRIGIGSRFAREYQVVLVLKGAQTLVCCPDGRTFICPAGNPGMASGGMGDVLTGMIAGFVAQGFSIEEASMAGVFIHGLCGDFLAEKTRFGFLASDMIPAIPKTIHDLLC